MRRLRYLHGRRDSPFPLRPITKAIPTDHPQIPNIGPASGRSSLPMDQPDTSHAFAQNGSCRSSLLSSHMIRGSGKPDFPLIRPVRFAHTEHTQPDVVALSLIAWAGFLSPNRLHAKEWHKSAHLCQTASRRGLFPFPFAANPSRTGTSLSSSRTIWAPRSLSPYP